VAAHVDAGFLDDGKLTVITRANALEAEVDRAMLRAAMAR
jgi:hypothetical protein